MNSGDIKNIIVLKNIQSNLIEEAIVVLKNNVNVKIPQIKSEQNCIEDKKAKKDYIVKEAEMHIAQYITNVENNIKINKTNKDLEKKYMRLKRIAKFLAVFSILGMLANILK